MGFLNEIKDTIVTTFESLTDKEINTLLITGGVVLALMLIATVLSLVTSDKKKPKKRKEKKSKRNKIKDVFTYDDEEESGVNEVNEVVEADEVPKPSPQAPATQIQTQEVQRVESKDDNGGLVDLKNTKHSIARFFTKDYTELNPSIVYKVVGIERVLGDRYHGLIEVVDVLKQDQTGYYLFIADLNYKDGVFFKFNCVKDAVLSKGAEQALKDKIIETLEFSHRAEEQKRIERERADRERAERERAERERAERERAERERMQRQTYQNQMQQQPYNNNNYQDNYNPYSQQQQPYQAPQYTQTQREYGNQYNNYQQQTQREDANNDRYYNN